MTKKDYELIADVISKRKETEEILARGKGDYGVQAIADLCLDMAHALQNENPRFNFQKFVSACGFPTMRDVSGGERFE